MHFHLALLKKKRITWFFSKMLQCSFVTEPTITYRENPSCSGIYCSPELSTRKGTEPRPRFPARSGQSGYWYQYQVQTTQPALLGLYREPPCALPWDTHTTGTQHVYYGFYKLNKAIYVTQHGNCPGFMLSLLTTKPQSNKQQCTNLRWVFFLICGGLWVLGFFLCAFFFFFNNLNSNIDKLQFQCVRKALEMWAFKCENKSFSYLT